MKKEVSNTKGLQSFVDSDLKRKIVVGRLRAASHKKRMEIIELLSAATSAGLCVGDIESGINIKPAILTFHLKTLVRADLIVARRDGRFIYYVPNLRVINEVLSYLLANVGCKLS